MMRWLTISMLFFAGLLNAQDYHFSQFYNAPLLLSPAKTGLMTTDYRAQAGHRNQWSAVTDAFVTSFASFDMPLKPPRGKENYFGVGGYALRDKAGASAMGSFQAMGSAAYHLMMNEANQLSTGLQLGWSQRTINLDGLKWDSQFNGVGYDPLIESGEALARNSQGFVESGMGIEWTHRKRRLYNIGIGVFHYFQNQSFIDPVNDLLLPRYLLTFQWHNQFNNMYWVYELRSQMQGGALENQAGARMHYRFGWDSRYTTNNTSSTVMAGLYYRYGDAIIPALGFEFRRSVRLWASYDVNISKLHTASAYRGGWEIHMAYGGELLPSRRKIR